MSDLGVWGLVLEDMRARCELGMGRYGRPVLPFNGRKSLVDLYEELLDACCYARQKIEEEKMELTKTVPQEWEYHVETVANNMASRLNDLGKLRWELVSCQYGPDDAFCSLILKRPK